VKQASNAKTKTTAAMLEEGVLIATQMASRTRTRHMPRALEMNSLRRPTRSIVHHWRLKSVYILERKGNNYRHKRGKNVEELEKAS
jgi:hypothetical protein